MKKKIAIVCPCYNEEDSLVGSYNKLNKILVSLANSNKISKSSFVLFVNDGSIDNSWAVMTKLNKDHNNFKAINLAFNSGHQLAIMAGMMSIKDMVDAAVTIDVDLQDDISCIPKMIELFDQNYDVVYGVKVNRDGDSFMKKLTASTFYKSQKLMGINVVENHADFRLLSKKVLQTLSLYHESNLYLRGLIPSLGFKSAYVDDTISKREVGKSKYSTKKMLHLAADGVVNFSNAPLKIVIGLGIVFLIIALINAIDVIIAIVKNTAVPGWSQLILSLWFIGGCILVCLGLLGLYIGRIYVEVKHRPKYLVDKKLD